MDILSGLTGSGAVGGLFGALGSGLGRIIGIFEMREKRQDRTLEMAHEKDLWSHETELQTLQIKAKAEETENELKLGAQGLDKSALDGSWAGLTASVNADAKLTSGYAWVEAVRALVRPALTVLIWLIFSLLFFAALGAKLPGTTAGDLVATFVSAVTFAASTALAWWFGDRGPGVVRK
ncbi:hypothetical protein [Asticcacaulis sp. EMRT-3]|uniref:hypothetical protein n=1 Tax=Asticcacaulis sp. EMRT-3 TaxID=3040349 RepID=UPI0024AEA98F|nr:hypothetical protein [Asticcacaulis sp. EMRT-3]MDI7774983.1 hypothetical protein [Asticcacaulis sp. EMRT-3]